MLSRIRYMAMAIGLPLTVALAAQAPAPSSARQTPSATFRAEVSYVEINARVIDRDGNFVQDVKQEDVQVLEDGKPQAVTTFGLVDLPFVPLERPAYLDPSVVRIEPDVASNRSALDGRLYVIVVDDFHISPQRTSRAREVARRFIVERLDANDRASIVVTSGDANGSQEFTANRRLLLEAVDSIVGRKLPSAAEAKADEFAREQIAAQSPGDDTRDPLFRMRTPVDMDEGKRNYQARAAMSVLRGIGEWMASVQGRRKSIVYISEGFDYDLADVFVEATLRDPNSFFSGSGGGSQAGLLSAEAIPRPGTTSPFTSWIHVG
jgi:VWFA-related protein